MPAGPRNALPGRQKLRLTFMASLLQMMRENSVKAIYFMDDKILRLEFGIGFVDAAAAGSSEVAEK